MFHHYHTLISLKVEVHNFFVVTLGLKHVHTHKSPSLANLIESMC